YGQAVPSVKTALIYDAAEAILGSKIIVVRQWKELLASLTGMGVQDNSNLGGSGGGGITTGPFEQVADRVILAYESPSNFRERIIDRLKDRLSDDGCLSIHIIPAVYAETSTGLVCGQNNIFSFLRRVTEAPVETVARETKRRIYTSDKEQQRITELILKELRRLPFLSSSLRTWVAQIGRDSNAGTVSFTLRSSLQGKAYIIGKDKIDIAEDITLPELSLLMGELTEGKLLGDSLVSRFRSSAIYLAQQFSGREEMQILANELYQIASGRPISPDGIKITLSSEEMKEAEQFLLGEDNYLYLYQLYAKYHAESTTGDFERWLERHREILQSVLTRSLNQMTVESVKLLRARFVNELPIALLRSGVSKLMLAQYARQKGVDNEIEILKDTIAQKIQIDETNMQLGSLRKSNVAAAAILEKKVFDTLMGIYEAYKHKDEIKSPLLAACTSQANCFSKSLLAATVFLELGIPVYEGHLENHVNLIVEFSDGSYRVFDANGWKAHELPDYPPFYFRTVFTRTRITQRLSDYFSIPIVGSLKIYEEIYTRILKKPVPKNFSLRISSPEKTWKNFLEAMLENNVPGITVSENDDAISLYEKVETSGVGLSGGIGYILKNSPTNNARMVARYAFRRYGKNMVAIRIFVTTLMSTSDPGKLDLALDMLSRMEGLEDLDPKDHQAIVGLKTLVLEKMRLLSSRNQWWQGLWNRITGSGTKRGDQEGLGGGGAEIEIAGKPVFAPSKTPGLYSVEVEGVSINRTDVRKGATVTVNGGETVRVTIGKTTHEGTMKVRNGALVFVDAANSTQKSSFEDFGISGKSIKDWAVNLFRRVQFAPLKLVSFIKQSEGAYGIVYLAELTDGRQVAIKQGKKFKSDERYMRGGGQLLKKLDGIPNIPRFVGDWIEGLPSDSYAVAMTVVPGVSLHDKTNEETREQSIVRLQHLKTSEKLEIIRQLVAYIKNFQERFFIHGDLRLQNVMVSYDEEGKIRVGLVDFDQGEIASDANAYQQLFREGRSVDAIYLAKIIIPDLFINQTLIPQSVNNWINQSDVFKVSLLEEALREVSDTEIKKLEEQRTDMYGKEPAELPVVMTLGVLEGSGGGGEGSIDTTDLKTHTMIDAQNKVVYQQFIDALADQIRKTPTVPPDTIIDVVLAENASFRSFLGIGENGERAPPGSNGLALYEVLVQDIETLKTQLTPALLSETISSSKTLLRLLTRNYYVNQAIFFVANLFDIATTYYALNINGVESEANPLFREGMKRLGFLPTSLLYTSGTTSMQIYINVVRRIFIHAYPRHTDLINWVGGVLIRALNFPHVLAPLSNLIDISLRTQPSPSPILYTLSDMMTGFFIFPITTHPISYFAGSILLSVVLPPYPQFIFDARDYFIQKLRRVAGFEQAAEKEADSAVTLPSSEDLGGGGDGSWWGNIRSTVVDWWNSVRERFTGNSNTPVILPTPRRVTEEDAAGLVGPVLFDLAQKGGGQITADCTSGQ
ncbi:MAG: protein kinase, partial [Patescibacteria group bacterium]